MTSKLYIDIDGVLLDRGQKPPDGAHEFIEFVIKHFDCHWLTTHCRSSVNNAIHYLAPFYDAKTIALLKTVKPTNWDTLKTEAIDFSSTFKWLEDYPFEAEKKVLEENNCLNSLIRVNLKTPNELARIKEILLR